MKDKDTEIQEEGSKEIYWNKIQEEGSKKMHLISGEQTDLVIWKEKFDEQKLNQWKEKFSYNPPTYGDMLTMQCLMKKEWESINSLCPPSKYPGVNSWLTFLNEKKSYINKIINEDTEYNEAMSTRMQDWRKMMEAKEPSAWLKDYEEKLRKEIKTIKSIGYLDKPLVPILETEQNNIKSWLALLNREIFILENDSQTNQTKIDELSKKRNEINSYSKTISQIDFNNKIIEDEKKYRIMQTDEWKKWKHTFDKVGGDIEKWKSNYDERIGWNDDALFTKFSEEDDKELRVYKNQWDMFEKWERLPLEKREVKFLNEMKDFVFSRHHQVQKMVDRYQYIYLDFLKEDCNIDYSPKKLNRIIQFFRGRLSKITKNTHFTDGIKEWVYTLFEIPKMNKFLDEKEKEIPFLETANTTEWKDWKKALNNKGFDKWKQDVTAKNNISDDEKHYIKTYKVVLTRQLSNCIYNKHSKEKDIKWYKKEKIYPGERKKLKKEVEELKETIGGLKAKLDSISEMEKVLDPKKPSIFKRISDTISAPFKNAKRAAKNTTDQKAVTEAGQKTESLSDKVQEVAAQAEIQKVADSVKDHMQNADHKGDKPSHGLQGQKQDESQSRTQS